MYSASENFEYVCLENQITIIKLFYKQYMSYSFNISIKNKLQAFIT